MASLRVMNGPVLLTGAAAFGAYLLVGVLGLQAAVLGTAAVLLLVVVAAALRERIVARRRLRARLRLLADARRRGRGARTHRRQQGVR